MVLCCCIQQIDGGGQLLHSAMNTAAALGSPYERDSHFKKSYIELPDVDAILNAMRERSSSNPIDKVCAVAYPFQKRGFHDYASVVLPIYDPRTPVAAAWEQLITSFASVDMRDDVGVEQTVHTPAIQLLRLFPHPSRYHWFPSWAQVQHYPEVSLRDNDPVLATEGIDYSLRIVYCSLQLIQQPTSNKKAVYRSTMGGKYAQLEATVPGIEPDIDSRNKYVLVDISPDRSTWWTTGCTDTSIRHEHLPIWQKSVILVCKEVDTLAQPAAEIVQVRSNSLAVSRYNLRRVTTLEWDCRQSDTRCWLPFEPSLVYIRSSVCSARGGPHAVNRLFPLEMSFPHVFCDPAMIQDLGKLMPFPVYRVFLV